MAHQNNHKKPEPRVLQHRGQPTKSAGSSPVGDPSVPEAPPALDLDYGSVGATYQRLSTPGQEDGTSLEKQSEVNLANAARRHVRIPDEYNITDIASGADPGRAGLVKLSRLVEGRFVQHVFVHDADRLARDPWHLVGFVRLCKENDVLLHFADGEVGQSILDEALQYFKGVFGYMERDKIAERTMDGKRKTALKGRMPNGCGYGLFPYDIDPITGKRVINEERTAIYLEAVDRAIGGVPVNAIATDFRRRGIRTKAGNDFDGRTLLHLLRNEAPTGEHWWGTRRWELLPSTDADPGSGESKRPKRRVTPTPREEWIRLTDYTPAIISPPRWNLLQDALDQRKRRGKLWNYEFSEFFVCGECGSRVNGASQQRDGVVYPYYRCNGTLGNEFRPRICDVSSYRARELEPVVWEHILAVVRDPGGVIGELRKAAAGRSRSPRRRIASLEAQVKKRRAEEATLVMQRTRDLIDQDMLEMLIAPITNLRLHHEKEIALLSEQQSLQEGFEGLEAHIRAMLQQYSNRLDSLDDEDKQTLLRLLGISLTGGRQRVLVTGVLDPSLFTTGHTLASRRARSCLIRPDEILPGWMSW